MDALLQVRFNGCIHFSFSCQDLLQPVDLLLQLSLFLQVEAVFARLLALNLSLQVLDMKVLFDLGLVLLALELGLLLRVLVLLFQEGVLEVLVLFGRLSDLQRLLLLLSLQLGVAVLLGHLVSDGA